MVMSNSPTYLRDLLATKAKTSERAQMLLDRYDSVSKYLGDNVHPYVTVGAAASDGGSLLTDHGVEHVARVTELAGKILESSAPNHDLSEEELYVLLVAIQFHDLGNITGRTSHEAKIKAHLVTAQTYLGRESILNQAILQVSRAHGGKADDGTLNTIAHLTESRDLRKRFLAAVLRLADELSDDESRTSEELISGGSIPPENLIYHLFAFHLAKVTIQPSEIHYQFHLTDKVLDSLYPYEGKEISIVEYIFIRIQKTELERQYCQRFLGSTCPITTFGVDLLYTPDFTWDDPKHSVKFELTDYGYPSSDLWNIWKTCQQLVGRTPADIELALRN